MLPHLLPEHLKCLLWVTSKVTWKIAPLGWGGVCLQGSPQRTEADPGLLSHLLQVRWVPGWSKADVTNINVCTAWKHPHSLGEMGSIPAGLRRNGCHFSWAV